MKRQFVFLLIIALFISLKGSSQECGGGILTLNLYTINGKKIKDASYEIFPVSKELIEKYNDTDNWNKGRIINNFSENEILPNEDLINKLNTLLERSSISKSGKFTSTLKFKTLELAYFPIIIKINIKNKTIYIMGNYFGGCDRETSLIWNGGYFRLI